MKRINSYDELKATVEKYKPLLDLRKKDGINVIPEKREILVCGDTGCTSSGSIKVLEALQAEIKKANLEDSVKVQLTGCFGFCAIGPIIKVYPDNIFYVHLTEDDAKEIVESHIKNNIVVERLLYEEPALDNIRVNNEKDISFYKKQNKIALRNLGLIHPERLEEYIANGGYLALGKALNEMT